MPPPIRAASMPVIHWDDDLGRSAEIFLCDFVKGFTKSVSVHEGKRWVQNTRRSSYS